MRQPAVRCLGSGWERWPRSVAAAAAAVAAEAKPCALSPPQGHAAHWPANHTGQSLMFPIAAVCQQGCVCVWGGNLAGLVMAPWGRCACAESTCAGGFFVCVCSPFYSFFSLFVGQPPPYRRLKAMHPRTSRLKLTHV